MPNFDDLIALVHGPVPEKPLPCFYDFIPFHAGILGGVPDFTRCYFDVEEKLRFQLKVKELLPEALILPGVFPDFGVVVEASAFGGQVMWFKDGAPKMAF